MKEAQDEISCYDEYFSGIEGRSTQFGVTISRFPHEFVFRRTQSWDDYADIRKKAQDSVKLVLKNMAPREWRPFLGSDMLPVFRAENLARRHIGCMRETWESCEAPAGEAIAGGAFRQTSTGWERRVTKFDEKPWGMIGFLRMSAKDPHGFQALIDAMDEEIGVGWSAEDRDYFRGDAEAAEG